MTNPLNDPKKRGDKLLIQQQRQQSHYHFFIYPGAPLIPGIVRMRDAPYYLGMNKTFFRDVVQPYLTRIPIDKKGIGFNRIELDRWIAYTQTTLGQPPSKQPPWENPNNTPPTARPSRATTIGHIKRPQPLKVKKSSLHGKPTGKDFDHLVSQMIASVKEPS